MITYDINVLIGAEDSTTKAMVKCNDSGINLRVYLKTRRRLSDVRYKDVAYTIPEKVTAVLRITKADGKPVLVDGPASSTSVFFQMPPQAFTAVGVHKAEVALYGEDGRRITSADFFIETTPECVGTGGEESEPYIDILGQYIQSIKASAAAANAAADRAEDAADRAEQGGGGGEGGEVVASAARISYIDLYEYKWQGTESPYSQVVAIDGVTKYSKVDINPSVEQMDVFHEKDIAFVAENEDGVVTIYCIGQKPTKTYTMQVTITEVNV